MAKAAKCYNSSPRVGIETKKETAESIRNKKLAEAVKGFNKKLDEASKAQAKKDAENWLKAWKDGAATEESFAELANKNSDDGDGKSGGLYEDVFPGQMVEAFDKWCFDKDRKTGDTEIIETEYGYHVMYFVKHQDRTYRDAMIEADLVSDEVEEWLEKHTKELNVEKVNLKGLNWDIII